MQQLILPKVERKDELRPQLNDIQDNFQRIEIMRGCKRGCAFCWADPNMQFFDVPEIVKNKVLVLGEGLLYDPNIKDKLIELGNKKVNNKVVYYGLSQGIDFRLLDKETAEILSKNRFGRLTRRGSWFKGIKFAWDGNKSHEELAKKTIDLLVSVGYQRKHIQVFVLVIWKIPYEVCIYKLDKLKEWGVQIDDCTWDTNKKFLRQQIRANEWTNQYWTVEQYTDFRKKSRKHNQLIQRDGYDPEYSP